MHINFNFISPALFTTVLKSTSEREFIEARRRGLGRFLNLVARHPFFSEDELVKLFLTFNGSVGTSIAILNVAVCKYLYSISVYMTIYRSI